MDQSLIQRAASHADAVAFRTSTTETPFREVVDRSAALAAQLLNDQGDLGEARVALAAPAGVEYCAGQWAVWRAGGICVPLHLSSAEPELEYALTDADVSRLLATPTLAERLGPLCARLGIDVVRTDSPGPTVAPRLPAVDAGRRAMILYTSGTTNKPKGVVTTHATIQAQIEMLVRAWRWQADDSIPLFLPLHHVHGIINVMSCALWSGATIEPFPRFDVEAVLERVAAGAYSVFMAVPTIYVKLIQAIEAMDATRRGEVTAGFAKMRLMVSGSAALPATVHETWTALTGQKLLERYGMTEIGMALSNPYEGERRPGAVGQPLPSVELRLKTDAGEIVTREGAPGEIQVRGPCLFREYWNRPEITAESFDDGWFRTGDVAVLEDGYYRILGRQSVDIIKSGGEKISALEIEATLLDHPDVRECAVVGLADETWGEAVAVAVVLGPNATLNLEALREWCRGRMSDYKIPKQLRVVDGLPRNAMGKVTKPAVRDLFAG